MPALKRRKPRYVFSFARSLPAFSVVCGLPALAVDFVAMDALSSEKDGVWIGITISASILYALKMSWTA
jgi:hypothetical protein